MPMTLRVVGRNPLSGIYKPSGNANAAQAMQSFISRHPTEWFHFAN